MRNRELGNLSICKGLNATERILSERERWRDAIGIRLKIDKQRESRCCDEGKRVSRRRSYRVTTQERKTL